jgi:hypothetical protein
VPAVVPSQEDARKSAAGEGESSGVQEEVCSTRHKYELRLCVLKGVTCGLAVAGIPNGLAIQGGLVIQVNARSCVSNVASLDSRANPDQMFLLLCLLVFG